MFAEWTLLPNGMMLRKDFELSVMLEVKDLGEQGDLFLSGDFDPETNSFEPQPIALYKPIEYWRVSECQKR